VVRARQSKNRLLSVYNAEGDKFTDHKAVSQEAVSFFQHLFGGDPTLERELVAEIRGIFYFTFSQEDGCLLSLPVEAEEMKRSSPLTVTRPRALMGILPTSSKVLGRL
jgi:hypothetical protein